MRSLNTVLTSWLRSAFLVALLSSQVLGQQSPSLGDVARQTRAERHPAHPAVTQSNPRFLELGPATGPDPLAIGNQREADEYLENVRELLRQEQFDELDRIASADRTSKARFGGGGWKLNTLYTGLASPPQESASEADWDAHLSRLRIWMAKKPESVTARIALASSYTSYAWKARGTDLADKVSGGSWEVFQARLEQARTILDNAARLKEKCPHWYKAMQTVALGQAWDRDQADELFHKAIAFEPTYSYYYRAYAYYLLPKWYGEDGETERFADTISKKIGGQEGSMIYFDIAVELICGCRNEVGLETMSWPRIQEGYIATEKLYGPSTLKLNQMAYIAVQMGDPDVAQKAFQRIGDDWSRTIWKTEAHFVQSKSWAGAAAKSSKASNSPADPSKASAKSQ
jgi:tetratricopeptide (TPR) repeat protein